MIRYCKKMHFRRIKETIIEKLIFLSGITAIVFVVLVFLFLLKEGLAFVKTYSIADFITGKFWYPVSEPAQFGLMPLLVGSCLVTLVAILLAVPLSLATAIFIAEISSGRVKEILKFIIELLSTTPSVVLGFIGMVVIAPVIKKLLCLSTGLTALTGSIILALMSFPTIVSIMEDAITAVPKRYKEAALAMGATHWQAIYKVLLPAASSGIVAAIMLGIGRCIGETMVVLMVTGNAAIIPLGLLQPVRTLTATIAAEMGETIKGSQHYFALFGIGIVLFVISFTVNILADFFVHKK
ncbi:MAG: phosphate ABC transporter permease subunit PstC [Elusimicrobiota bacterium]|nr:phosphate ABC transporter permease subunit PstC [Elusimicrobiota bacterium]